MQESQPKKGKKARRKRNDSDEDIEKVLAELELEYSGQKDEVKEPSVKEEVVQKVSDEEEKTKKKGKNKQKADKTKAEVLTEDEIQEEEGFKKKGKNKQKNKAEAIVDNEFNEDEDIHKKKGKNKQKSKSEIVLDNEVDEEEEIPKKKGKNKQKNKSEIILDNEFDEEEESSKKKGKNKQKNKSEIIVDDEFDEEEESSKKKGKNKQKNKSEIIVDDEFDEEEESSKKKGKNKQKNKSEIIVDDEFDEEEESSKKKGKNKQKNKSEIIVDDEFDEEEESSKKKGKNKQKNKSEIILDDEFDEEEESSKKKGKNKQKSKSEIILDDEFDEEEESSKKKGKNKQKNKSEIVLDEEVDEEEESFKKKDKNKQKNKPDTVLDDEEEEEEDIKKKKKEKNKNNVVDDTFDDEFEGSTVKTAAQKKKEKKEREKQKKLALKKAELAKKGDIDEVTNNLANVKLEEKKEKVSNKEKPEPSITELEADTDDSKKKKKKGAAKEDVKEKEKEKGKGPGKKAIAAMQEALKKIKEEEEKMKREEEERLRQEELKEKARLEQLQLEQERKERKKLKEKQRKERLKAEGKLLTTKQKQDRARAQAMIEALKARGLDLPDIGEKKPRPGTRIKPNKLKQQTSTEEKDEKKNEASNTDANRVQLEIVDQQTKDAADKKEEEVKDSWDAESSQDEHEEDKSDDTEKNLEETKEAIITPVEEPVKERNEDLSKKDSSESVTESDSGSVSASDDENEDDSGVDDKVSDGVRKKERAQERIQNRRIEAEKKKSLDNLRAAVICVLGHVDTGKTKILDKLRRTNVQDSEAGGITQQIGATNVPIEAIQESTKHVKGFADKKFKIPGLLIIDTPGHESFSNLRNRGSSLCDFAILVVDIMHGLEPQTIESINLLKEKKCPFIVALNKIDRLYDWQTMNRKDVQDIIKGQGSNTQREFEKRSKDVIVQFAEQGLNAALYYENPDSRSYVSLVPTSAITGEGMGNLLALIVDACQGPLAKRLMYSEELQATVLEVKALPGLGTTIDCILVNGMLREGDTMIVAGTDGPIVTQIRSLLMPQPLKELRVKNAYIEHREVKAAQGVKIAAKDLEKAIAGLNLQVAQKPDEVDILKEEIARELSSALGNIRLVERGVYVQASTLGALEALLDFLMSSKIPYAGIRIGPVVKKDVMKASIMLEHDSQYATILAFDVKIERDAQELADSLGVKIFQADIIYHLFDKFTAYREELKQRKRDEHKHIAVFPCKLKILPQYIFNSRDPIVMGVMVEAGIVKEGTPVCVPSKDFVELGVVTSIEYNHKSVDSARKGQEVCVKIEPIPGEAPKMFGRHFDEKDFVVSKISRQSIDACKEYFRDDLCKNDWQLMLELKRTFEIL